MSFFKLKLKTNTIFLIYLKLRGIFYIIIIYNGLKLLHKTERNKTAYNYSTKNHGNTL